MREAKLAASGASCVWDCRGGEARVAHSLWHSARGRGGRGDPRPQPSHNARSSALAAPFPPTSSPPSYSGCVHADCFGSLERTFCGAHWTRSPGRDGRFAGLSAARPRRVALASPAPSSLVSRVCLLERHTMTLSSSFTLNTGAQLASVGLGCADPHHAGAGLHLAQLTKPSLRIAQLLDGRPRGQGYGSQRRDAHHGQERPRGALPPPPARVALPADARAPAQLSAQAGYTHFDTAAGYGNEEAVGQALRDSGKPRSSFFVTTKVINHVDLEREFDKSLERLGIEYIDLYLMHWPLVRVALPFTAQPGPPTHGCPRSAAHGLCDGQDERAGRVPNVLGDLGADGEATRDACWQGQADRVRLVPFPPRADPLTNAHVSQRLQLFRQEPRDPAQVGKGRPGRQPGVSARLAIERAGEAVAHPRLPFARRSRPIRTARKTRSASTAPRRASTSPPTAVRALPRLPSP